MEHALAPVTEHYCAREDRFDNPALIQLSGPGGTPIGLRGAPCGPVVSLRRRLPARLPRWPPFAADGPSSFAGCTRSIRSSVPAAEA
jgi:hypothetical protein